MSNQEVKYQANGTIRVHLGAKTVTFIPCQYVEQNGSKFIVFVPQDDKCEPAPKATPACVVKAKEVPLSYNDCVKEASLLEAAVNCTEVTVVVVYSSSNGLLTLKEAIIPAVPKTR